MKILVLPKYFPEGSSSRYRYYNYEKYFVDAGIDIFFKPLLYNGYVVDIYSNRNRFKRCIMTFYGIIYRFLFILFNKRKYDIFIIEKEILTFCPYFIEKLLLKGVKYIVDYDDNISARYQVGVFKYFLSNKIINLVRNSSYSTVGNNWYFDLYKDADHNKIFYLPTVVDVSKYEVYDLADRDSDVVDIVWIGSPSTVRYLSMLDDIFCHLNSKYKFRLKVVGGRCSLNYDAEFVEWSSATEINLLKSCDIGIMPLEQTEWEKGKCGFKLIQYMAAGLSVIASPAPANMEILNDKCGLISETICDWENNLSLLIESSDLRKEMGYNSKQRIKDYYSYQVWGPKFVELVKSCYNN